MFKSYFFVPADKRRFLEKSNSIENIDYRIFDLEDSVSALDIEKPIGLLSNIEIRGTDWLRIPLIKDAMKKIILDSMEIGLNNYIIPKFEGLSEAREIIGHILSINSKAKFILLIENAKSYIELEQILSEFNRYIHGVSLGIHDFAFTTGMKNDYVLLQNIRVSIMLLARAYLVVPIDVVSPCLTDEKELKDEILNGFQLGYRAKFFIHPFQLDALKSVTYYTQEEINDYKKVLEYYFNYIDGKEVLFSYNNRVYEKMHIKEIKKIVEWGNEFYGTDR